MRYRVPALAVLLAGSLAACSGKDGGPTSPTTASLAGTWTLQSVNGTPLPYVLAQSGPSSVVLVSDVITATADTPNSGSFTRSTVVQTTANGAVTTQSPADAGTWTLNGTAVVLHFNSDGSTSTGTVSGNSISAAYSGLSFVYTKS